MSFSFPLINDVTTDIQRPPQFVLIAKQFPHRDFGHSPEQAAGQTALYPDLKGLVCEGKAADQVFKAALELAQRQPRWTIVSGDAATLRIEGTAMTAWLHFRDDFVIEIRPDVKSKTAVEMRSKSRIGKSDLGANAKRILHFLGLLGKELGC